MLDFDCGVYAIYGPNGRAYIGSTLSFKKRWRTHRQQLRNGRHHSVALQRAFDKYGERAFTFAKIAIVAPKALLSVEQAQMDARPGRALYNSSRIAGNCLGVKHSAETRAKLSLAHKGIVRTQEWRANIAESKRGSVLPESVRAKIAQAKRGTLSARNTSGHPGVHYDKRARQWRARVMVRGVRVNLGGFPTIEAAAHALDVFKSKDK